MNISYLNIKMKLPSPLKVSLFLLTYYKEHFLQPLLVFLYYSESFPMVRMLLKSSTVNFLSLN